MARKQLGAAASGATDAVTKATTDVLFDTFNADLLTTGQETISRRFVIANTVPSGSGTLRFTHFTARKSETSTQVRTLSGGTAQATPTTCKVGLYTVGGNGDLTRVAVTANTTTLWASTNTLYTTAWGSSYAMVAGQRYALGFLFVGTTAPTFAGQTALLSTEMFVDPRISSAITGQTDCLTSYTNASLVATQAQHYAVILP